jgi:WD40 repeat protein/serine/threonine protein kinase
MSEESVFGLNPEQLSRLLSVGEQGGLSHGKGDDEKTAELLERQMRLSLCEIASSMDPLADALNKLGCEAQSLADESLLNILLDRPSDSSILEALNEYSRRQSSSVRTEAEHAIATTIYYAAAASLLVHHERNVTTYSYESLAESFAELAAKTWMMESLKGLFLRAYDICKQRQVDADGVLKRQDAEKKPVPVEVAVSDSKTDRSLPDVPVNTLMEKLGTRIGGYKIIDVLGEGGMGVVYRAEQQYPVQREVALKIIKPGMDSKRIVARFEAEQQALALLDHPNIAHVFDAGATETGRPYFVMEYVRGVPITDYCDRHRLGIEERLRLFLRVCQGIHHAHQKGIIHRDIKPSNILVTVQDGQGVPKVIDFGVATVISEPLLQHTLYTEQGQLVGTPEYMSPEQAEMTSQDIDVRSDIYSLGILLYVLLTGVLPFDAKTFREGGLDHIRKVIREQDPKTPSTRVSTLGDEAQDAANKRGTDISTLAKRLHKELEWIPLKAMRKERERRYQSVSELAGDVQNYLSGAPLLAAPESTAYIIRKFMRRHRTPVTAAACVASTLVLGLVVSTAMFFSVRAQRRRAETLLARAQIEKGVNLLNEGNCLGLLDLLEARTTADRIADLRSSTARLWAIAYDLWSRQLVHVMPEGQDLAMSPDGRLLAIAKGKTARLWNIVTGEQRGPPLPLQEDIAAVLFSPDGKLLAITSKRGVARLWDPNTGLPAGPVLQQGEMIPGSSYRARRSAAFSPDGRLLATGLSDGTVQLWKTDTAVLHSQLLSHGAEVICVAFSPNGRLLATGSRDNTAQLWTVATGEPHGPPLQHNGPVEKVTFSPDGKLLATAGNQGKTYLWNTSSVRLHKQLTNREWMHDLAFSPDGELLAGGSFSWVARLWDTDTGEPYGQELRHNSRVTQVAFSHDGKLFASGSLDGTLCLWRVPNMEAYGQPLPHTGYMVFSPDGKLVATTGYAATRIWRLEPQLPTQIGPYQSSPPQSTRSGDGEIEATISGERVELRDMTTGTMLGDGINVGHSILAMGLSPGGRLLATGHDYWKVKLWSALDGHEIRAFGCYERPYAVAFGPDGKVLGVGLHNGEVVQWDLATGKQLGLVLLHPAPVWALAYSPCGNLLAVASGENRQDASIRIWDISAGPPCYGLTLPSERPVPAEVVLASFRRDGTIIVGESSDGRARLWQLPSTSADLHEIQLRTWIALGSRLHVQRGIAAIPWEQHRSLRTKLCDLLSEAE